MQADLNPASFRKPAAPGIPILMGALLLVAGCSIFGGRKVQHESLPSSGGIGDSLAVAAGDSVGEAGRGSLAPHNVQVPEPERQAQKPRVHRPRPVAPHDPVSAIATTEPERPDTLVTMPVKVTVPVTIEAKTRLDRQITHDLLDTRDHLRMVAPSRLTPEQQYKIRYIEDLMNSVGTTRGTDLEGAARLARKAMLIARELARTR